MIFESVGDFLSFTPVPATSPSSLYFYGYWTGGNFPSLIGTSYVELFFIHLNPPFYVLITLLSCFKNPYLLIPLFKKKK